MHLVPNEAGRFVDQMNPLFESVFEIDFVALGYGDAVRHDDHEGNVKPKGAFTQAVSAESA
jgi:hypothetical protein